MTDRHDHSKEGLPVPKYTYLPEKTNDFLWVFVGSPWTLAAAWLLVMNLAAFLAFGWDKHLAKRKQSRPDTRRIPERTLFLLAILGGSIGALAGMRVFHHKTLHRSFRWGIPAILLVQILLPLSLWLWRTMG